MCRNHLIFCQFDPKHDHYDQHHHDHMTIIIILASTIFRLNVGLLYLAALCVLGPAPAIAKLTLAPLRGKCCPNHQ